MKPVVPITLFSIVLFVCHSAVPAMGATQNSQQAASATEGFVRQATFIFVGTVVKVNATTMPEVQATESTAVVRVDEIIEAPGAPPDLRGQEITIQLLQSGSAKPGEQITFFTKGWLLGNSMAVIEVGRGNGAQSAEQLRDQVRAMRQKIADEALQTEIASAEVIIAGTVSGVRPAKISHIGSEHDPDWYEANITFESVEKGHLPGHTVTVLFPHSDDVMWQDAPKFKEGQQGIWLLHRNQMALPGIKDQYTVLKPLDFQVRENLQHIRDLRKTAG